MIRALANVKNWLVPRRPETKVPSLFAIPCSCSHVIEGHRQPSPQQVICPRCGEKNFVFPQSTWPSIAVPSASLSGIAHTRSSPPLGWRAGMLLLGVAIVLGFVVWLTLANRNSNDEVSESDGPGPVASLEQARAEMAQGKYLTALDHLESARRSSAYERLPRERRRELEQCRLEAAILADLSDVPLSEILSKANDTPRGEWLKVFERRFRGRAVLLDGEMKRDAAGKLLFAYRVPFRNGEGRVRTADLDLIKGLALARPIRVIFGARLAGISQRRNGDMLIHLEPKSGVLMTNRAALEAAFPVLRKDPELAVLLRHQEELWKKQR